MCKHNLLNRTAAARRARDYGLAWALILTARTLPLKGL